MHVFGLKRYFLSYTHARLGSCLANAGLDLEAGNVLFALGREWTGNPKTPLELSRVAFHEAAHILVVDTFGNEISQAKAHGLIALLETLIFQPSYRRKKLCLKSEREDVDRQI